MKTEITKEDLEKMFTPNKGESEVVVRLEDGSEEEFKSLIFKYGDIKVPSMEESKSRGGMFG